MSNEKRTQNMPVTGIEIMAALASGSESATFPEDAVAAPIFRKRKA